MLTLLLLSIATICSANEVLLPHVAASNHIYSAAAKIANKHFDLHFITLVYSHSITNFDDPLEYLFREYRGVLSNCDIYEETKLLIFESRIRNKITQYVIEVRHVRDLDCLLGFIKKHKSFDNNGKFILICDNRDDPKDGCDAKLAFVFFWNYLISNVIFLYGNKQKQVFISTYFPLSSDQCQSTEPIIILEAIQSGDGYEGHVNAFPNKFVNFNRCKLILSTANLPPYITIKELKNKVIQLGGSEGPLAHILVEKLNATMEVVIPADGELYGKLNGTVWTGFMGHLSTKRANMSLGTALMTASRVESFQAAYPYRMYGMVWVSPPSRLRPAWEKLLKSFDRTLRIYLFTLLLVIFFVFVTLRETRVRHLWRSHFSQDPLTDGVYLETCAIFLGQVGRWRPRHMVLSFALILWIWFTFIMRNSYQGALIGPLKYDVYEPQFSTLQEAVDDGFEIGGDLNFITYIADEPELYNIYKVLEDNKVDIIMEQISNGSLKLVYIHAMITLCSFNLRAHKTQQLNFLPQFGITVPLTNFLARDSPLVETVDAVYGRIVASGIEAKYMGDNNVIQQYIISKQQWLTKTEQMLSLRHMQACFTVMAVSSLVSALVFILELLWSRRGL